MVLGVPARERAGHVVPEQAWAFIVEKYVQNIGLYREKLRRLD
jgi:hypothetical protein